MTFHSWLTQSFDPSGAWWISAGLFHFVWQATVIAALIAIASRAIGTTAQTRYGLHLAGLLAMAFCIPFNLLMSPAEAAKNTDVSTTTQQGKALDELSAMNVLETERVVLDEYSEPADRAQIAIGSARDLAVRSAPETSVIESTVGVPTLRQENLALWVVLLWLSGVALMTLRLFVALIGGWRLQQVARSVTEPALLTAAMDEARRIGLRVVPVIAWCERVSVPLVVGIVKPMILLPPVLLTGLNECQLRAILAHEFAHVRRLDPFVNVLQRVIESVLFFHPAIWYASHVISQEREICCDDMVLSVGNSGVAYADALVSMAEICTAGKSSIVGVAASGNGRHEFKRRVMRLLVGEPTVRSGSGFAAMLLLIVTISFANAAMTLVPFAGQDDSAASPGHPEDLIAVLGEDRARHWGGGVSMLLPSPDNERVYLCESLGFVSAFDTETLKRVLQFRPHQERCLDIALIDSGKKLVTISTDGTVALWNLKAETPQELDRMKILPNQKGSIWMNLSSGRNTDRIAVRSVNTEGYNRGGDDSDKQSLVILDVKNDRFVKQQDLPASADAAWNFAISHDGKWLVTCENKQTFSEIEGADGAGGYRYRDATLVVRDLNSKAATAISETPHKTVNRFQFAPDGTLWAHDPRFVTDRQSHSWSIEGGKLVNQKSIPSISSTFAPLVFDSDGSRMAVGSKGNLAVSFSNGTGEAAMLATGGSAKPAFLNNGSLIVSTSPTLQRWDLNGGTYTKRPSPTGHKSQVQGLLFDPRTNSLLTAGDSVREWSLAGLSSGEPLLSERLPFDNIGEMWLWPQGKGFLLSRKSDDGRNIIQGVRRSGKKMLSRFRIDFGSEYQDRAWCAALHPTEPILATGHWDRNIRTWDISSSQPKQLAEWKAHKGHVCDIAFSHDGKMLASAGWDKKTILWTMPADLQSKPTDQDTICEHEDVVWSVTISPDSRFVASGGKDGQILVWDQQNPDSPRSLMQPEDPAPKSNSSTPATVGSLQFNRTGTRLLSGDGRGRVTVWSIPDGKIVKRWQLAGWIWSTRYSPDESMIATGNGDGTIFLLRSPEAR